MKKVFLLFAALLCCLPILGGCTGQTPDVSLTTAVSTVYMEVLDPYDEGWLNQFDAEKITEELGVDASLYTEASVYASSKASRAAVFAGFSAAEGKMDALIDALQKAKENAMTSFDGYLPDQYLIAKNAEIKQYGDYCFLIMTEQNETVVKALEDFFNGVSTLSSSSQPQQ